MKITEVSTNISIPVFIKQVEPADFKSITKRRLFFDWEKMKGVDLYKLITVDDVPILGLIGLIYIPSEDRVEIELIAVSKENVGRNKHYEGIAGCLIAHAVQQGLDLYGNFACISLLPKTEIRQHYIKKYGMKQAGQNVYLAGEALYQITKEYMT